MENTVDQVKKNVENIKKFVTPFFNLAVSTTIYGYHNIVPTGKLILTCNHRSDMDPFVIGSVFPRFISWIAAEYTTRIPLFKDLVEKTGTIPMAIDGNISMASIKKVQQVFKNGDVLGIFPEGHDYMVQNDFSAPLAKFHDGFAAFSLRNKVDILPAVIIPEEETISDHPIPPLVRAFMGMPKEVCEIKKRVVYKKVNLVFGEVVKYQDYAHLPLAEGMIEASKETKRRMGELQKADFLKK
ncbi:lysophospholipid acyltransferase family protein [Leptospira ilyithenensis]|uniref:1-acyl-sn-glycerol-3-phosphate acyltransferase n=1 Tax=Leptospira ilyithenensis TaxID=2484901 RepID=A0A4R9LJ91_9LEPT|nr:lysophospholipid acyltransferase family protein [Leptospira ilyithenensis]TGN06893.1 1-acyl-sn-glycerol-3-phosphate acyltransferase [Leptospira ilyithenensis]